MEEPAVRVQGSQFRPVLPVECEGIGDPQVQKEGSGIRARWRMRCPGGLAGKSVGVEGIAGSQADAALRRVPVAWPQWSKSVVAYGIGAMATFWFLQRAVSLI